MTRIQQLGYKDYEDYLSSETWLNRRTGYAATYPQRCFVCDSPKNCCLHHISYENVGNEKDEDLIWLCRHHHERIHNIQNGKATIPTPKLKAHIEMRDKWIARRIEKQEKKENQPNQPKAKRKGKRKLLSKTRKENKHEQPKVTWRRRRLRKPKPSANEVMKVWLAESLQKRGIDPANMTTEEQKACLFGSGIKNVRRERIKYLANRGYNGNELWGKSNNEIDRLFNEMKPCNAEAIKTQSRYN